MRAVRAVVHAARRLYPLYLVTGPEQRYLVLTNGKQEYVFYFTGATLFRAIQRKKAGVVRLPRETGMPSRVANELARRGLVTASWLGR